MQAQSGWFWERIDSICAWKRSGTGSKVAMQTATSPSDVGPATMADPARVDSAEVHALGLAPVRMGREIPTSSPSGTGAMGRSPATSSSRRARPAAGRPGEGAARGWDRPRSGAGVRARRRETALEEEDVAEALLDRLRAADWPASRDPARPQSRAYALSLVRLLVADRSIGCTCAPILMARPEVLAIDKLYKSFRLPIRRVDTLATGW